MHVYTIVVPARVRDIENNVYKISEYIIYKIYLSSETNKDSKTIIVKIAL